MFKEERDTCQFDWGMIGDVNEGRPNLGNTMDVAVYRRNSRTHCLEYGH